MQLYFFSSRRLRISTITICCNFSRFLSREPSRNLASFQQHFTLYQFITYAPFTFRGLNFLNLPSVSRFFLPFSCRCRVGSVKKKKKYINISPVRSFYDALQMRLPQIYSYFQAKRNFTIPSVFCMRDDAGRNFLGGSRRSREIHHCTSVSHLRNDSPLSFSPFLSRRRTF